VEKNDDVKNKLVNGEEEELERVKQIGKQKKKNEKREGD
jgi:hypothetical protein